MRTEILVTAKMSAFIMNAFLESTVNTAIKKPSIRFSPVVGLGWEITLNWTSGDIAYGHQQIYDAEMLMKALTNGQDEENYIREFLEKALSVASPIH